MAPCHFIQITSVAAYSCSPPIPPPLPQHCSCTHAEYAIDQPNRVEYPTVSYGISEWLEYRDCDGRQGTPDDVVRGRRSTGFVRKDVHHQSAVHLQYDGTSSTNKELQDKWYAGMSTTLNRPAMANESAGGKHMQRIRATGTSDFNGEISNIVPRYTIYWETM